MRINHCIVFLPLVLLLSCGEKETSDPVVSGKSPSTSLESETGFSRNTDTLRKCFNLEKYKPVNVMWKEVRMGSVDNSRTSVPGPTDYKLEAFIQFDRATAERLKSDFKHDGTAPMISVNDFWFSWLPTDLKLKDKADSSYRYEATPFFQSPLLNGSYVFINVNTILVSLYTM